YWCYDRHRSVRLVVLVGLAIDQIAQSGLSSLSVIYYSAQLFRDAVRVYLEDLYPDEGSKYIDKMVDKVASVAIPIAVHQKCSETYGGRNNRKVETESGEMITKKELDARDLEAAVNANWDANAECLKNEYGMSNEKIEEIRAKLHKLNRNVGLY
ncbi:hypothetical protein L1C10_27120, partial [Klebsiella pneumoniae]|uniref:hypothetical protein n=1 Tax=Klebsiella pneumoniae TaxID=573 RepID=UPI0020CC0C11